MRFRLAAFLSLAGAAVAGAPSDAAEISFAGKTVHIVVNQAAGGPTDAFIRNFTRFFEAHIPGHPTIVVEDQTGAAGMVAANNIYNVVRPDGLTIALLGSITNDGLLGGPGVKFDLTKFGLLAAIPSTQVTVVRRDAAAVPRDLLHPQKPLVYAEYGGWVSVAGRLFLDMIGAPYKYVTGYDGQPGAMQAVRTGEANIADAGAALYMPNADSWKHEGVYDAIAQRGDLGDDGKFHRSSMMPNLPTVAEAVAELNPAALSTPKFSAYEHTVGANLGQYLIVLPPGANPDIFATLSRATANTFRDPEAVTSAKEKLQVEYSFMDSAEATRFVARLKHDLDADPAGAEVMRTLIRQ